jgi:hypothetical protein
MEISEVIARLKAEPGLMKQHITLSLYKDDILELEDSHEVKGSTGSLSTVYSLFKYKEGGYGYLATLENPSSPHMNKVVQYVSHNNGEDLKVMLDGFADGISPTPKEAINRVLWASNFKALRAKIWGTNDPKLTPFFKLWPKSYDTAGATLLKKPVTDTPSPFSIVAKAKPLYGEPEYMENVGGILTAVWVGTHPIEGASHFKSIKEIT